MRRDVDLSQITDGKRYSSRDMVRIGTHGCEGCSECCRIVGDTIILDPRDIYELERALSLSINELMATSLDLRVVDGLIQPMLRIRDEAKGCVFLNDEDRCRIHDARPGFCRMFPLGRLYEDGSFSYILQVDECPVPNKTKVAIDKWIGIPNLKQYENYIIEHHDLIKQLQALMELANDTEVSKNINLLYLQVLIMKDYDTQEDFYPQFQQRLQTIKNMLGL